MNGPLVALVAMVAGCSSPSPARPTATVATVEPTPAPPVASASEEPSRESFTAFSERFRRALAAGEAAEFVGPDGVLLSHNPGAFIALQHVDDWAALVAATPSTGRLATYAPTCDPKVSDDVPRFDCDTSTWSIGADCVEGEARSTRPAELVDLAEKYELLDAAAASALRTHAQRLQSRITHFLYDTDMSLGFYFGRRGDTFELLWADAVEPCSA